MGGAAYCVAARTRPAPSLRRPDRIFALPRTVPVPPPPAIQQQYLLPKKLLTVLMGHLANLRGGALTHAVIRKFVAHYKVNMEEAAEPRIERYPTFNEFFTRPLREGARPLAEASFVCPVDA